METRNSKTKKSLKEVVSDDKIISVIGGIRLLTDIFESVEEAFNIDLGELMPVKSLGGLNLYYTDLNETLNSVSKFLAERIKTMSSFDKLIVFNNYNANYSSPKEVKEYIMYAARMKSLEGYQSSAKSYLRWFDRRYKFDDNLKHFVRKQNKGA